MPKQWRLVIKPATNAADGLSILISSMVFSGLGWRRPTTSIQYGRDSGTNQGIQTPEGACAESNHSRPSRFARRAKQTADANGF
jgi:hypothetical protein